MFEARESVLNEKVTSLEDERVGDFNRNGKQGGKIDDSDVSPERYHRPNDTTHSTGELQQAKQESGKNEGGQGKESTF